MQDFHENRTHGSLTFPLQVYSHHDKDGFYSVSQHWHQELEWIYVDVGTLHLTVHGDAYTLQPGEMCFINSGELHEIRSTGESLHHAIVFQADFLDFALYDVCEHQFIHPVTSHQLSFTTCPEAVDSPLAQEILKWLRQIVQDYHEKPTYFPLDIKICILQVLKLLYQTGALTKKEVSEKEEENLNKLKKVISYIQNNYAKPLTLQDLAQVAYLSPAYFCNTFRKQTGASPITFLNEYRIERATQLLVQSDDSISNIAAAVGFENFSYFIRKFREYKHVTPKEYRMQARQNLPGR